MIPPALDRVPLDRGLVDRAGRIRRRAFRTGNARQARRLLALADEAHTIADCPPMVQRAA